MFSILSKRFFRYKYVSLVVIFGVVLLEIALYGHLSRMSLPRPPSRLASRSYDHARPFDVDVLKQHTHDATSSQPTFLLILAYYRTGSSILGDLLNQDNDTFYSYEPLYGINTDRSLLSVMRNGVAIRNYGAKKPEIVTMTSEAISILEAIFTCNLHLFQDQYLMTAFPRNSRSFSYFNRCLANKTTRRNTSECIQDYVKYCQSKRLRVVKSIRIRMSTVEYFLKKYQNFRVVHLIRDPRGSLCSMECVVESWKWRKHCQRVEEDITTRRRLNAMFPNRMREIIFEKFALHPIRVSREIYNFVGRVLPQDSARWVFDKTMAGKADDGVSGTTRPDSIKVAFNWTSRIKNYQITYANTMCSTLLRHGKFLSVNSTKELANFITPKRTFNQYEYI